MTGSRGKLWAAALAGVSLLAGVTAVVSQEKQRELDRSKNDAIEKPLYGVARGSAPVQQPVAPAKPPKPANPRLDMTKSLRIEPAVKNLVATATAAAARPAPAKFVNPKVQPGKVRWHADYAAACRAAATSKKPVLLFQMMGRLDDHFC
jgi:hypothetical protein